ncbi:hypothetical protein DFH09DRAFT_1021200 [Mycena vulgaris]|nr:hypothetical protein DFH09DRAFT_1021200 [Mycena vulgaris]
MTSKAITAASTHFLQFRIQYSSLALLYYDFFLTFPKEVQYIWRRKFRLSTAFYICCRYALVANVLYLLAIANKLGSTCDSWYKIIGALSILGRAAVIGVFTMRTYAVWDRNNWVLGYMGIIGLTCIALDITHVPGLRCVGSSSLPLAPELLSIFMVIFEASSAVLITWRCVMAFRAGGGVERQRHGVMFILFEQGILYFSTITIITTAAVILNYRAPAGFLQRLLNAFILPLSGILTARFILYLREWETTQGATKGGATEVSAVEFRESRTGVISTIVAVQDFGVDPVVLAKVDRGKEMELQVQPLQLESDAGSAELDGAAGSSTHQVGGSNISLHKKAVEVV